MPFSMHKQGDVIYSEGQPLQYLSFITNGTVEASFAGRSFRYKKGDTLGFYDIGAGGYSHTYTAVSDVALLTYPYENFGTIEKLLCDNADVANRLVESACRQIAEFMRFWSSLRREADSLYVSLIDLYPQYERLCKLYAAAPGKLLGYSALTRFTGPQEFETWLHDYYVQISDLEPSARKAFFHGNPGISSGFVRRGVEDVLSVMNACRAYVEYLKNTAKFFINSDGHDLFSLISELHLNSINIRGADIDVESLMVNLTGLMSTVSSIDFTNYMQRLNAYRNDLVVKRASQVLTDAPSGAGGAGGQAGAGGSKANLADHLNTILDYSECPDEMRNKFSRYVHDYAKLADKNASDDEARRLRNELTSIFYKVYQLVLAKSLKDPGPSTIINMFLNFGYVDPALAGQENADFLYTIADTYRGDPQLGVYTLREWLTAIYNGQKEPNRSEFDMDYTDTIRDMKAKKTIDAKEETRLMADLNEKLRFEMENAFPSGNKITFGRVTTFCPLFSEHNVQRKLEDTLLTPGLLKKAIDEIRDIDFSAFYRETMYSNTEIGVPKEFLHVEVTPDFILMPNAGIRGVMWQEIEGKKRTTPARIFLPAFLEGDVKSLIVRLTGEFRWEMCRRVQGARWNDLSEPSLTSEYCDYLQFYKKNSELTTEMKDNIKSELDRAKKNYRAVFVSNYADWLQYESKGSLRLNRIVRRMLLEYCTFAAPIREKLKQNPQYAELFNKFNIKQQRNIRHVSSVMQKVRQSGKPIPKELQDELEFMGK